MAQVAHLIEPVTRQRDDQARLTDDSRKVSLLPGDREPLGAVASGLPSSDRGQIKGASTPSIWPGTGKREEKGVTKEMYQGKRGKEGCEYVPSRAYLIARTDLPKECASFRQFSKLSKVSSYYQVYYCL
ncbi:hypothetical protein FOXYSP1_17746 [Fusarium oxysporum f. sp. phaseoli]